MFSISANISNRNAWDYDNPYEKELHDLSDELLHVFFLLSSGISFDNETKIYLTNNRDTLADKLFKLRKEFQKWQQ